MRRLFIAVAVAFAASQPASSQPASSQPASSSPGQPETLVQHLERRIDAIQHRESQIKAFIDADLSGARSQARALSERNGSGAVYGLVVGVKDNIGVAGFRTTAGSSALAAIAKTGDAAGDAPVVGALRREGAVIIGTTNMDTWARGVRGLSEVRGQTANPLDPTRNAGGSSAGSAAAVAAGMVDLAIGTDTCGSIRYPASSVGIYGLKPTWGSLPLQGVVPLAPGQDVVGPLAADVDTLRRGWVAMGGRVRSDPPVRRRIGLVTGLGSIDPAWLRSVRAAGMGTVDLGTAPDTSGVNLIEVQYPIAQRAYLRWRKAGGDQTWIRADGLTGNDGERRSQRTIIGRRRALAARVQALLDNHDVDAIAYPANIAPPALLGARQPSGNCMLASGSGLPAIVVPGVVAPGRLAIGVELLGRAGDEDVLLAVASLLRS